MAIIVLVALPSGNQKSVLKILLINMDFDIEILLIQAL